MLSQTESSNLISLCPWLANSLLLDLSFIPRVFCTIFECNCDKLNGVVCQAVSTNFSHASCCFISQVWHPFINLFPSTEFNIFHKLFKLTITMPCSNHTSIHNQSLQIQKKNTFWWVILRLSTVKPLISHVRNLKFFVNITGNHELFHMCGDGIASV